MSASGTLHRSDPNLSRRQLWAAHVGGPTVLDFNGFGNGQGILKFYTKVSIRTVHLGVA